MASVASAAPTETPDDLPTLPLPPLSSLNLTSPPGPPPPQLDATSWSHLRTLLKQALESTKVLRETWEGPLFKAIEGFVGQTLSPQLVELSRAALAVEAATTAARREELAKSGRALHALLSGALHLGGGRRAKELASDDGGENETGEALGRRREERRARWRDAAVLLPHEDLAPTDEQPSHRSREASVGSDDWEEVQNVGKVAVLSLFVDETETTLSAVHAGSASLGIGFVPDEWEGRALFGDGEPDLGEADLKLVKRLGGTFRIVATSRDAPKIVRVLEFLLFAVISLSLEDSLLVDLGCPRPQLDTDIDTESQEVFEPFPLVQPDPLDDTGEDVERVSSLSNWQKVALDKYPTVDFRPRRLRTSFSAFGAEGWSKLIAPHPPLGQKFRKPGKRIVSKSSSTSAGHSSVPASPVTSAPPSPSVDPSPASPSTPTASSATKMKNKLLGGFKDRLHLRKKEGEPAAPDLRLQKAATLGTDTVDSETGWLGIGWLGSLRGKPDEEKTSSAATSPTTSLVPHEKSEGGDTQPAQPLLRFEKVVKDLAGYSLSVSPNVLFPPPQLLFRLREQELAAQLDGTDASVTTARLTLEIKTGLASLLQNNSSLNGNIRHQCIQVLSQTLRNPAPPGTPPCQAPKWLVLPFYQHRASGSYADASLGTVIQRLVSDENKSCVSCSTPNNEHCLVLAHGDERIEISLRSTESESFDEGALVTWTTCPECLATTTPALLSPAAQATSFAKFLELLLYDASLIPVLCEHVSTSRLIRSFAQRDAVVDLRIKGISLFELRLPTAVDPDVHLDEEASVDLPSSDSTLVEDLKHQIETFFADAAARLDELEDRLAPDRVRHAREESVDTIVEMPAGTPAEPPVAALHLLRQVRRFVQDEEADLLCLVEESSAHSLNPSRYVFETRAKALKARLAAWEKKHHAAVEAGVGPEPAAEPRYDEPEFFAENVHAFPIVGTKILVKDEERISSLIALTLSAETFKEATTAAPGTSRVVTPSSLDFPESRHPSTQRKPIPSMFLDPLAAINPLAALSISPPRSPLTRVSTELDPDDFQSDFTCTAKIENIVVKSRKPPPSNGSLFRGLLRPKSSEAIGSPAATQPIDAGAFFDEAPTKRFSRASERTVVDDILSKKESAPSTPRGKRPPSRGVPTFISSIAARREGSAATTLSTDGTCAVAETPRSSTPQNQHSDAAGTIRSIASLQSMQSNTNRSLPSAAASDAASLLSHSLSSSETSQHDEHEDSIAPLASSSSRLLTGLFSGIDSVRSMGSKSPLLGAATPVSDSNNHEHVKLKFRHGGEGGTEYRVTAYYARRFAALRKRCGLSEDLFVESLSHANDLNPSGGKSSAAFLMTGDKRFMLKELVTKFGSSELDTLLNVTPQLLKYLMKTEGPPSLLAKILGVYTVKIVSGGTKKKVDIVVMEHLFHNVSVSRQYDLKGISSRVAKPKAGGDAAGTGTGWDGDWLTGSLRDQLLIFPHSKSLLREALTEDVKFLADNDGIDFSLLIGVNDSRNELVVGLIDFIGVFNVAKRIEHNAKTAARLGDASAVTILPPSEYAKRFLSAMERYFVAVPDKWQRPPGTDVGDVPRLPCPL